jgi:hypothetical protein
MKNYPEFKCYRDIAFYFKYFMNTEDEAFPRPAPWTQKHAELVWKMGEGEYIVLAFGLMLYCRPKKKPFTHRFPSTATPSFLTNPHPVNTEDDVLHIKVGTLSFFYLFLFVFFSVCVLQYKKMHFQNLPSFDDALGQRDSELLISYLTVPYLRIPLVMTFFSTEDRIHALKSKQLQDVFDSVLFEPGRYLPSWLKGEPHDVPTSDVKVRKSVIGTGEPTDSSALASGNTIWHADK